MDYEENHKAEKLAVKMATSAGNNNQNNALPLKSDVAPPDIELSSPLL